MERAPKKRCKANRAPAKQFRCQVVSKRPSFWGDVKAFALTEGAELPKSPSEADFLGKGAAVA